MNPRIIAGTYKNRRLKVSDVSRPITDRAKTSMFDKLSEVLVDAKVCDLFAGSGSIGIEALSRGAKHVVFVDDSYEAVSLLKANLENLKVPVEQFMVLKNDVKSYINKGLQKFDLIFIDPPFRFISFFDFKLLHNISDQNTVIVLKSPKEFDINSLAKDFTILDTTKIGINTLVYMRRI